ncbi:MAG: polysaccharide pyruvyl transferase CsaB [Vulcanimicrobiaceae bacterium]
MRILLSGYYGFGNLGDEAILATIVAALRTRFPLAQIEVLSATPEVTAQELGISAAPRWEQAAIREAIARCDVLLSGGGGLMQSATSLRSLLYYAGIVRSALRAGRRAMIFAQSIGPLDFWGKQTLRECCRGLSAATVRDERSRALLASLVPGTPIERTADPVFLYDPPPDAPPAHEQVGGPLVVAAVRKTAHWPDGIAALAASVDRLAERYGARTAFVPFAGAADAEAATAVIRRCNSKPMLLPLEGLDAVAAAISRASLVIGVRLHALILAARFGVPFLAVPYDPKVSALLEDLAYPLPPLWTPGERAAACSAERLDAAWSRRDQAAEQLRDKLPAMRARAARNVEVLAEVVATAP